MGKAKYSAEEMVGNRSFNKFCNEWMEIIEWNGVNNILIKFEDGHIKKSAYEHFNQGKIQKYSQKDLAKMRLGEQKRNNDNELMTIIKYNNTNDMTIEFEDGNKLNCQYIQFKKGNVKNHAKRLGMSKINSQNQKMTIIEYNHSLDIKVKFEDSNVVKAVYDQFYKGTLNNPNAPSVFKRGYIGIGKYNSIDKNGKHPKSYKHWSSMFYRCYSEKAHKTQPSYINCEVDKSFWCYQDFMKWFNENYYTVNNEKMTIDKDLLFFGNKIYSPEKCLFLPDRLNVLISNGNKKTNGLPRGVHFHSINKNYIALNSCDKGGSNHLGSFSTPELAFQAYKKRKEEYVKEITNRYKNKIPKKAYDALMAWEVKEN